MFESFEKYDLEFRIDMNLRKFHGSWVGIKRDRTD